MFAERLNVQDIGLNESDVGNPQFPCLARGVARLALLISIATTSAGRCKRCGKRMLSGAATRDQDTWGHADGPQIRPVRSNFLQNAGGVGRWSAPGDPFPTGIGAFLVLRFYSDRNTIVDRGELLDTRRQLGFL